MDDRTDPLIPSDTWILCHECGARQFQVTAAVFPDTPFEVQEVRSVVGTPDLSKIAEIECHWCEKNICRPVKTNSGDGIQLFSDRGWLP